MTEPAPKISFGAALGRGLRGRCPACGEGPLFRAHLKVADACAKCGEEFHHHRADDFPAYLVVLVLGHILVPFVMFVEKEFSPPYMVHVIVWSVVSIGLAWLMLRPAKGAVVALQWHMGMHGFDAARKKRQPENP